MALNVYAQGILFKKKVTVTFLTVPMAFDYYVYNMPLADGDNTYYY